MERPRPAELVSLTIEGEPWARFFAVAPLVLVATLDAARAPDVAPKHMAMPLGWQSWFCFVCSPSHGTYVNAVARSSFTVSYPGPDLVVQAGLAASPRGPHHAKPALAALDVFPAAAVDGVLVAGCDVFLECELDRVLDGFGENSLVIGRVVAAAARAAVLRDPDRDDGELLHAHPLLAYVHPGRIASIRDTNAFPFPAGFSR